MCDKVRLAIAFLLTRATKFWEVRVKYTYNRWKCGCSCIMTRNFTGIIIIHWTKWDTAEQGIRGRQLSDADARSLYALSWSYDSYHIKVTCTHIILTLRYYYTLYITLLTKEIITDRRLLSPFLTCQHRVCDLHWRVHAFIENSWAMFW